MPEDIPAENIHEVQVKDMNVVRHPEYRLVYANFARGGLSAMDVPGQSLYKVKNSTVLHSGL